MEHLSHDLVEKISHDFSFPQLVILSHVNQHLRYEVQNIVHSRMYYRLYRLFGSDEHVKVVFDAMDTLGVVVAGTFPLHVLDYARFKNKPLLLTLVTPKGNYQSLLRMLKKTTYHHVTIQEAKANEHISIVRYAILTTASMNIDRYRVCRVPPSINILLTIV